MEHRNIDGQPAILVVGDMALRHGGRTSRRTSDGDGCWQADGSQGEREGENRLTWWMDGALIRARAPQKRTKRATREICNNVWKWNNVVNDEEK